MPTDTDILNPESPRWNEFAARLGQAVIASGCRHGTSHAEAIMCSMGNIDVASSLAFFRQHGSYCDCEIIFNVALED